MRRTLLDSGFAVLLGGALSCSTTAPRKAPGVPPSPQTVTRDNPGGDAFNPHHAALTRQLTEPFMFRPDRDDQLLVPLPDAKNWKRVRYWLVEHFTGFRYGEDYHALNVVFVQDVPAGRTADSASCMLQVERWARPQLNSFNVKLGPIISRKAEWRDELVELRLMDAVVDLGFGESKFSTAWAAYPAYPEACMVFALAVPWRDERSLALKVRDRWIKEAVPRLSPLTETRPYRK